METPSMDSWTSLFLIVSALGLFLTTLMFSSRTGRKVNGRIGTILLGFSLVMIQYVLFWTGYRATYPYLHFFDSTWYVLFGPLMYGYIRQFYNPEYVIAKVHYAPALFVFIMELIYLIKTQGFVNYDLVRNEFGFYLFGVAKTPWIGIFSLVVYQFFIWDILNNQPKSNGGVHVMLRARWTKILARLFALFSVAYISYYVLVRFEFFNPYWDYAISFTMAICIYTIGYFVYKEPAVFNGELLQRLFVTKNNGNNAHYSNGTLTEFYQKLVSHIEAQQSYLNADLRLVHLAQELELSTHDLSQVINTVGGVNFNTFINSFRLEQASQLLTNSSNESIKSIYYQVGFNSKSAFYKAFKAKYNCSPQEYKSKHL